MEVDHLVKESYRPGTRRNLKTQANTYYQFCAFYDLKPLPASDRQLIRFAVYLHVFKQLLPDTIDNYLSGVRTLHGLAGVRIPAVDNFVLKAVLKGMKYRNKRTTRKAAAIDPDVFRMLLPHVDLCDDLELVGWVAILMGFHLLLRVSNLTSRSRLHFDPSINLCRKDFRMVQDILLVHIKWTKTLQFKERKLLIPVISFTDPQLSAVKWFKIMINRIPAKPSEPAFSVPCQGVNLPLSYSQLTCLLKKWTTAAQLDSHRFTGHCLRRGGASWLDVQGVPDRVIQVLGDWKTQCFKEYIDSALHTRLQAMVAFAQDN